MGKAKSLARNNIAFSGSGTHRLGSSCRNAPITMATTNFASQSSRRSNRLNNILALRKTRGKSL